MQVQTFDQRELKRAIRGRKPGFDCMPEMGIGQRIGNVTVFNNQGVKTGPPVASGLTKWYRASSYTNTPAVAGATTGVNASDAVSASPAYIINESPNPGVARKIVSSGAGNIQHGITRAFTGLEATSFAQLRFWVRVDPFQFKQWIYVQTNAGGTRIWFNLLTGVVGTIAGSVGNVAIARSYVSPTDGFTWRLIQITDLYYTSGGNIGLFIAQSDNTATFDDVGAGASVHYDVLDLTQDKLASWTNLQGGATPLVGTATNKPQTYARSSLLQGEPSVHLDSGKQVSDGTAASWQFMHDGAGCTWAFPYCTSDNSTSSQRNIFTTNGSSATATGVSLTYDHSARGLYYDVGGAASNKIHFQSFFTADTGLIPHWVGSSLASADSPDCRWYIDGVEIATGNPSGGLTAAVPGSGLVLGGGLNGGPNHFEIPELLIWNRALTAAEWQTVHYYFKSQYGTA